MLQNSLCRVSLLTMIKTIKYNSNLLNCKYQILLNIKFEKMYFEMYLKKLILLYIKRDDIYLYIYIYIYPHHFTDTTASTLTSVSAKTVKDIKLKLF